jgi:hypothetical protein
MRDLAGCKNWADLSERQLKWLEEAMSDWSAEATKLLAVSMNRAAEEAKERRPH